MLQLAEYSSVTVIVSLARYPTYFTLLSAMIVFRPMLSVVWSREDSTSAAASVAFEEETSEQRSVRTDSKALIGSGSQGLGPQGCVPGQDRAHPSAPADPRPS